MQTGTDPATTRTTSAAGRRAPRRKLAALTALVLLAAPLALWTLAGHAQDIDADACQKACIDDHAACVDACSDEDNPVDCEQSCDDQQDDCLSQCP